MVIRNISGGFDPESASEKFYGVGANGAKVSFAVDDGDKLVFGGKGSNYVVGIIDLPALEAQFQSTQVLR